MRTDGHFVCAYPSLADANMSSPAVHVITTIISQGQAPLQSVNPTLHACMRSNATVYMVVYCFPLTS